MGRSSRQAASDIWDKMAEKAERGLEIRTRQRDRKRKAGTKTSNGVGDEGKEERGRERKNKIHFYSSRKYKLKSLLTSQKAHQAGAYLRFQ